MFKSISLCKHLEALAAKLRSIIAHDRHRNPVTCEYGFCVCNHMFCCRGGQLTELWVVTMVVNQEQVVLAFKLEKVHSNFFPRPLWLIVWQHWLFGLLVLMSLADITALHRSLNVTVHVWPIQNIPCTSFTLFNA